MVGMALYTSGVKSLCHMEAQMVEMEVEEEASIWKQMQD